MAARRKASEVEATHRRQLIITEQKAQVTCACVCVSMCACVRCVRVL